MVLIAGTPNTPLLLFVETYGTCMIELLLIFRYQFARISTLRTIIAGVDVRYAGYQWHGIITRPQPLRSLFAITPITIFVCIPAKKEDAKEVLHKLHHSLLRRVEACNIANGSTTTT